MARGWKGTAAFGDKFKRFTAAFAKATLAGASASARFLRGKLPIALVLWNKLPERGWPRGVVDFLKHPPRWFVGPCSALAIWVVGSLLLRLVWAVARGGADDVSKLLIGLAGLLGAPFLIWRTWTADQAETHRPGRTLYRSLGEGGRAIGSDVRGEDKFQSRNRFQYGSAARGDLYIGKTLP